tara:strand:+ start:1371 stop:1625 length:255 start_codon:yes stop_codon:yes gene_type:complete
MGNHKYWVDSKDEMLNMAKDPNKIGSIFVLEESPYKLIGSFGATNNSNFHSKGLGIELFIKCTNIGNLSMWEDSNGFTSMAYQY